MERLTEKDFENDFCLECRDYGEPNGCNRSTGTCDAYDFCGEAWDKLSAYEDTNLTPAEITEMNDFINSQCAKLLAENERLKARIKHQQLCGNGILQTLELADAEMTRLQTVLAAKDKEIKHWMEEYVTWRKALDNGAIGREIIRSDRDRWKARAEALERGVRGDCGLCTHTGCKLPCQCINGNGWQFHEGAKGRDKNVSI